jgi:hypothetical protein
VKLTNERKLYSGILGLALAAIAVDRLFLGSTATGPAPAAAEAIAVHQTPGPAPAEPAVGSVRDLSLAQRVDQAAAGIDPESAKSVFLPPEALRLPEEKPATTQAAPQPAIPAGPKEQPKFRLTGIMNLGAGPAAMINGKSLRQGDMLEGWTLESLSRDRAVLKRGANQIELSLERSKAKNDGRNDPHAPRSDPGH